MRALQVFHYQYTHNELYRQYCDALHTNVAAVAELWQIPVLPISFFKTHNVLCAPVTASDADLVFESSGTTGTVNSRHYVWDGQVYEDSLLMGFEQYYGHPGQYAILALLPSYLERANASLVYMAKTLMKIGGHPQSGFYLNEWEKLRDTLLQLEQQGTKTILLGVTFALLDLAAAYPMPLRHTIVMETGGMKGRRKEMTRDEVHEELKAAFGLAHIHSEYGMTELLSQAYAPGEGIFRPTATMQALVRDINDPLDVSATGTGALNIIDLANIHSCAFIATEDIGSVAADGSFTVLGRMDNSALRGCSLMAV
ncbi:acyltransferase [Nemorincola caseinilytica]|uniref:Acyltransferase n=1 Tax=Nemorincola caseinilytica TaxID=2054315 RepID=A0ABP8N3K9_9BACT